MSDLYWPFDTAIVTEWCGTDRSDGSVHMGVDFGVPQGTELRATVTGKIIRWNSDGSAMSANVLDILRPDGLLIRNAHLSQMFVNTGDQVKAGDVIGLTGGTPGTWGAGYSTGAHLHWELRWDQLWHAGAWIDPRTLNPDTFNNLESTGDDDMRLVKWKGADFLVGPQFLSISPNGVVTGLLEQLYGKSVDIGTDNDQMNRICRVHGIADEVKEKLYNNNRQDAGYAWSAERGFFEQESPYAPTKITDVQLNVDALAQAIADRLGSGTHSPDVTTKSEILSAIEANYPEGA